MAGWLAEWLYFKPTCWQASWLTDQLAGLLVICMVDHLEDMSNVKPISGLASWLTNHMAGYADGILTGSLVYWLVLWRAVRLIGYCLD